MIRSRLALAALLTAILVASCGSQPDVAVSVAGVAVPMARAGTTTQTPCSTTVRSPYPANPSVLTVRAPTPVTFEFYAGEGATDIRVWIYDLASPTPSGGPLEEFTLAGRGGKHESRSIVPARTYEVLVSVRWSSLITSGSEGHAFRMRVEPGG
jgi:hypothetical protein